MNSNRIGLPLLAAAFLLGWLNQATAQITITGDEIWDGVSNPRAGDGVLLSGGTYTIPDELVIGSGATIFLNDPATKFDDPANVPTTSVTFDFAGATGGLTFTDSTSLIDVHPGTRNVGAAAFTLNMGLNDILGDGKIINGAFVTNNDTGDTMNVRINSQGNVQLGEIDITRNDSSQADIRVEANGSINISRIANPDVSGGGSSVGSVFVRGSTVTLGPIDTRAERDDGQSDNGNVFLTALGAPGFDPGDALANTAAENVLTLSGLINTNGDAGGIPSLSGNVELRAVKIVLESGFALDVAEQGVVTVDAGEVFGSFTEADLFMDMAASGLQPNFNVAHDIPEPSTIALTALLYAGCGALRRRRV